MGFSRCNTLLASLLLSAMFATQSHAGFVVDGIYTEAADVGYEEFEIEFVNEDAGASSVTGSLHVGFGSNMSGAGASDDIFILLEVPTAIQDLTYGDNSSLGWRDSPGGAPSDSAEYNRVTGNESWSFCFGTAADCDSLSGDPTADDANIQVKMKDIKINGDDDTRNDGEAPGYRLRQDDDDLVVEVSTSLDYNLKSEDLSSTIDGVQTMADAKLGGANDPAAPDEGIDFTEDSPFCGDPTSHTSDQDCYDFLDDNYSDYQYAQSYEFQIDNSLFMLNDTNQILAYINNSLLYAAKPKFDAGNDFFLPCLGGDTTCDPVNTSSAQPAPGAVPLTSSLSLFTLAGLALVARRRRTSGHMNC